LKVYDILGREVATLVNGAEERGLHKVSWDATNFSTGTYFVRLTSQEQNGEFFAQTKKILVLK
jgi:hypothetical protein